MGERGLTLRLRIGKKGYVILPKAVCEAVGIEEGDEVIVEIKDGIVLKPVRKMNVRKIREAMKEHIRKLEEIKDSTEPLLGDLATVSLEEEFAEYKFL